ncbi:MAG: hypothetical protein WC650_02940 [Candidatus Doudnabacteria bacterium]
MKGKNILDGSPYRLDWLIWLRGVPGVVIIVVALVILALVGWHFFNQYTEDERSNVIAKPATQSAALATTAQSTIKPAAQQQTSYEETVVSERPKPIRKTAKHYSGEAEQDDEIATETATQDEQEVTVESDSFVSATGEAPVAEPVVDYWSSVNGYAKAVENQSKEINEILKKLNGGK